MAAYLPIWMGREILDHILRKETYTPTYTVAYMGLATSGTNLENNLLTDEVGAGLGYLREQVGVGSANVFLAADTSSVSYLDLELLFDAATADWGVITHMFLADSATLGAGNVLVYWDVTPSRLVETSDVLRFLDGDIYVGF